MELHIDTKKDSPDDLRKAIRFLQLLVGEHSTSSPAEDQPVTADMFSMFDSQPSEKKNDREEEPERDDEGYRIIPY